MRTVERSERFDGEEHAQKCQFRARDEDIWNSPTTGATIFTGSKTVLPRQNANVFRLLDYNVPMKYNYPKKLKSGDSVRVIAPSQSHASIDKTVNQLAKQEFEKLGLKISYGSNSKEIDRFNSSSIKSRIEDLHEAFADPSVDAIITARGGFNANQLLDHIDWSIIESNPKIFCGFSDITILNNAILGQTDLVTYSGPNYSKFGKEGFSEYTADYFMKCLFSSDPFNIRPSKDSEWLIINEGESEGTIIGGNLCTLNLLQGTKHFPNLEGSILFLEDDHESKAHHFDRNLQSLLHMPTFQGVRGIVIGRFQAESQIDEQHLREIISSKKALRDMPVITNVDFGHTDPMITFPVGGSVSLSVSKDNSVIKILGH